MKPRFLLVMLLLAAAWAADPSAPSAAYRSEMAKWRQERAHELRTEWLTLSGLFWLKPGTSTFGSASDNAIVLPKGPAHAGVLAMKEGNKVGVRLDPAVVATVNGKRVRETPLQPQPPGPPTVLALGTLRMHVIVRGDRVGLRLRDLDSPALHAFQGVKTFPVATRWRITGEWVASPGKKIPVMNVLNDVLQYDSPGVARFIVAGETVTLRAVVEDDKLFFIFADATSGNTTYGAGRYLYAAMPKGGKVTLDFNQAFTPPCGYTPYATCPLPPQENKLKVAIEAGERYTRH